VGARCGRAAALTEWVDVLRARPSSWRVGSAAAEV
jgi:hypothetical protein